MKCRHVLARHTAPTIRGWKQGIKYLPQARTLVSARHTAPTIRGWKPFLRFYGFCLPIPRARHTAPTIRGWKLTPASGILCEDEPRAPDTPPRLSGDGNKIIENTATPRFRRPTHRPDYQGMETYRREEYFLVVRCPARHTAPTIRGWKPTNPAFRAGSSIQPDTPPRLSGDGNRKGPQGRKPRDPCPTHRPDYQGMETSLFFSPFIFSPDTPPRLSGDGNLWVLVAGISLLMPDTPPRLSGDGNGHCSPSGNLKEQKFARHTAPTIRGWKRVYA